MRLDERERAVAGCGSDWTRRVVASEGGGPPSGIVEHEERGDESQDDLNRVMEQFCCVVGCTTGLL